ncbi:hypothetical protein DH2020_026680 [Rehmannia glutinosa]|uniref:Aminotransferase-like plant mobile domain-containing protein n=1 Tax=Rehmannia glutinosa TaxID=99300 RepID=A0ABR0VYP1_REHGL
MILNDESQSIDKGTILAVFDPIVRRYATAWLRLTNPSYLEEWSKEIPSSKTSKTWTLQVTHHQQSTELTLLPTLGCHVIEGQAKGDDVELVSEFHYIKGYWEWTKYVLSRCKNSFQKVKIYDDVYASLFMFDNNSNIMRAFCEAWCPSTNTLLTSFGEFSVSLWDLHTLVGLPISGSLYNEVVPCAKELTGFNEAASRFLPRSCSYLLHAYHHLRKFVNGGQSSQVPVIEWIRFWSKKSMKYNKTPPHIEKKRVARPISTYNPLGNLDVHGEWSPAEKAYFSKINIKESLREETYLAPFLACGLRLFFPPSDINMIRPKDLQDGGDHGKWAKSSSCACGSASQASTRKNSSETTSLQFVKSIFLCDKVDISSLNLIVLTDLVVSLDFIKWYQECLTGMYVELLWIKESNIGVCTKPNNRGGPIDANGQAFLYVAPLANDRNAQANKRKSTSHHVEESSSNVDRHWKRPKKDSGSLPSEDVDDIADHPLQMETFVEELEKDLVNIDDDESQGSQRSIVRLNKLARNSPVDKAIRKETRDLAKATKTPHCNSLEVLFACAAAYDEARSTSSVKSSKELLARQLSEARDYLQDAKTKENKEFAQIMSTKDDLESIKKED